MEYIDKNCALLKLKINVAKNCSQVKKSADSHSLTLSTLHAVRVPIDHFTVLCLVTWPLNDSEAGGDPALIQTSLLFVM